jgi:hypothetical protein
MSITVELPKFDDSYEATITDWNKNIGDQVEVGDVMVVLKIDGSPRYLEAFDYGTLSEVFVREGETVRSGQAIAILTPWPSPPVPTTTILGSMEGALSNYPVENGVSLQGILHFIGWLVAIILPWYIGFQVDHFLRDHTPLWTYWPARSVLLTVALGVTAFFFWYGVRNFEGRLREPSGHAEIEAWFRTHWPNMPSNCQITAIEPAYSFREGIAGSTRIRINDGHGFRVNLYYDLTTKQMLGCRAYPQPPVMQV